jgi:hypothetical protein
VDCPALWTLLVRAMQGGAGKGLKGVGGVKRRGWRMLCNHLEHGAWSPTAPAHDSRCRPAVLLAHASFTQRLCVHAYCGLQWCLCRSILPTTYVVISPTAAQHIPTFGRQLLLRHAGLPACLPACPPPLSVEVTYSQARPGADDVLAMMQAWWPKPLITSR